LRTSVELAVYRRTETPASAPVQMMADASGAQLVISSNETVHERRDPAWSAGRLSGSMDEPGIAAQGPIEQERWAVDLKHAGKWLRYDP